MLRHLKQLAFRRSAEQLLRWAEAAGALGLSKEVTLAPEPGQKERQKPTLVVI
jgi:hypothetical protein